MPCLADLCHRAADALTASGRNKYRTIITDLRDRATVLQRLGQVGRPRKVDYDAVLSDLATGLSKTETAAKHNITTRAVYNILRGHS